MQRKMVMKLSSVEPFYFLVPQIALSNLMSSSHGLHKPNIMFVLCTYLVDRIQVEVSIGEGLRLYDTNDCIASVPSAQGRIHQEA